ncbi:tau-tubulin kinase homolog Asator-like isoform X1 [Argiope bruennichi]|uniref:tau-tubulin kinase homolog Asator-like isoform X1 n=1 Tax=Argiope bruennichi TaxID=94029 RepID=UPI0024953B83|nr:tau-tubulin kinase homolog Asator-like isoform X1 [Argiope bruennichi]
MEYVYIANSSTNLTMGESMLQTGHVVKDKWQVVSKIGQGAFGEVYKCKDFTSNRQVALKLVSKERITSASHLLKLEVTVLKELQGKHYFPKFVGFGKTERFDYLVMELLGPSLSELKKHQPDRKFSLSTTLRLGHMMLKCIHAIHKTGYLHRDIKPSNFTIGIGEDNRRRVYLLDFGLARQYVLENGEVRPPRYKVSFHGTPRYASLRVLQGKEAGRQDDLMSLFYTLSEFSFRDLPWKNIRDYREMAQAKEVFDHQILVKEFPDEFQDFYNHISELTFFDQPDYDLLYSVFDRCIKRRGVKETDPFDFEETESQRIESDLKKDNSSTAPTKSSSDVLIIHCESFEESEKLKAKDQIKRSKSTCNNLLPTSGLGEVRKEQLLRSKSSNNMMNKKKISNFLNDSKDTGFSLSPSSTKSHCQPSVSISIEPKFPVNKSNLVSTSEETKAKLKSESSAECNKCLSQLTESFLMDSLSKDNSSFETKKIENMQLRPLNKFFKKDSRLFQNSCINSLSTLRCYKDKNKKQKTRHSVRRSVSHPATIPSHLLIKSIFHDSNKVQGQQGLPRCWSCPTISLFIRSDLKPPLKQQASFDENVYEVDVMRNVAAKQPADEPVHVDCRRNSLPFIHTSKVLAKENSVSSEENRELILNNISDSGISSLSVTRRAEATTSETPNINKRSISNQFEKTSIIHDITAKVQKSLSDSNVYQRSINSSLRGRHDSQDKNSNPFGGIELKENALQKVENTRFFVEAVDSHHCNMVKNIINISEETVNSVILSKREPSDQYPSNVSNNKSCRYTTTERNDEIMEEKPLVFGKDDIDHFEMQPATSDNTNKKSEIDYSICDNKDYERINDSKTVNEKNIEKNLDMLESLVSSSIKNFQTDNQYEVDTSAVTEGKIVKSLEVYGRTETQTNLPIFYVTENENDNIQSLEIDAQRETLNSSTSGNEISNVTQKDPIVKDPHKIEEAYLQNQGNRRHRVNSENKYVKDESELKLHFIRRRQRPSSVNFEAQAVSSEEYQSCKFQTYASARSFGDNAMSGIFQNPATLQMLQSPPDDPPTDYCLPSRRRRYRRAATSLASIS